MGVLLIRCEGEIVARQVFVLLLAHFGEEAGHSDGVGGTSKKLNLYPGTPSGRLIGTG